MSVFRMPEPVKYLVLFLIAVVMFAVLTAAHFSEWRRRK